VRVFRAPGRVNLVGGDTGHNLGLAMAMAADLACFVSASPGADERLTVFSHEFGESRSWPAGDIAQARPARHWSDYVLGVARELVLAGYEVQSGNLLIWSTVPIGAGLGSSSALEVATALALLGGRRMKPLELAELCRRAENDFAGVQCGILDQYISVFGEEGCALRVDCRGLEHQAVPLPAAVAEFVVINTMVKLDRRARRVPGEDERVDAFAAASRAGDLGRMGELLSASHRSLQMDYEANCQELDFLVETALRMSGVYGVRMTGGGGCCTLNMVDSEEALHFQAAISEAYQARFGLTPEIYPCRPAAGAGEIRTPAG
jgi:galactokinase